MKPTILESYNPAIPMWEARCGKVTEVHLVAKLLLDGAREPVGRFRKADGSYVVRDIEDFFTTEREAVLHEVLEFEDAMKITSAEIAKLIDSLGEMRVMHAALVKRLEELPQ